MRTPEEIADELKAAGVDPALSVTRAVRAARAAGVVAQTMTLRAGVVEHKRRAGLRVVTQAQPPGMCRRSDAAGLLGVSVKRVDQLRAEGRLASVESLTYPFRVWITLESVREERRRRGLDSGLVTP